MLKEESPERFEELSALADDVDRFHDIKAIVDMPGGRQLIDGLTKDVVSTVNTLSTQFKTLSHTELIALCAFLNARLTLMRVLTRASVNFKDANALLEEELQT